MPLHDRYGEYRAGRPGMTKVCNSGEAFAVYRVAFAEEHGGRVTTCAILYAGGEDDHAMLHMITALPGIFVRVRRDRLISVQRASDAPVNPLLYERPPRVATTAMLGRHRRDLHVVPAAGGPGAPGPSAACCCFRVTALSPKLIAAELRDCTGATVLDMTADESLPRGTAAHRTLPEPSPNHLTEVRCADDAAYWECREALAQSARVQAAARGIEPGHLRWLPASGTQAFELILNPLNRASEEWNTGGYNQASPAARAEPGRFGPSRERHKWMGILPSLAESGGDDRVYTWEQLARAVHAQLGDPGAVVAIPEPLHSHILEQTRGAAKRFYRSEAHLQAEQDRQLCDAAYRIFVRAKCGVGSPHGPTSSDLVAMPCVDQASCVICIAYLLHGFQPRRQRSYVPNGMLSGATGRPRSNWREPSNQSTYTGDAMREKHHNCLKRSLEGSYVRHEPVLSRTKYPARHKGCAIYRPHATLVTKRAPCHAPTSDHKVHAEPGL